MLSDLDASQSAYPEGRWTSRFILLACRDPDRETAGRIAQALITVFIESSLSGNREDTSGSLSFVDAQIKEDEARLIEAQNRIANFKQENFSVHWVLAGGYYQNLTSEKAKLEDARLMLKEEENREVELQRQIDGEDPLYDPLFIAEAPSIIPKKARRRSR